MFSSDNKLVDVDLPKISIINDPFLSAHSVHLALCRLDLIHAKAPGNKWYKLHANLQHAKALGYHKILTFGGAFSNHIHALALLGHSLGFQTIGIIRGERFEPLNPTLADASHAGMQLHFIDRSSYRLKHSSEFLHQLRERFGDCYVIPEGGANQHAVYGIENLLLALKEQLNGYQYLALACGTGATLAGVLKGAEPDKKILGIAVHKDSQGIVKVVNQLTNNSAFASWHVMDQFHCGGYAKLSNNLVQFMNAWQQQHAIPIEPIYTGKLFYAIYCLIHQGYFPRNTHLMLFHTGGLQGFRGIRDRFNKVVRRVDEKTLLDQELYY